MFYKLLQRKRDEWLRQENCPINSLLSYIQNKGMMRDAQIEAIKTYLFLKISCNNKPLIVFKLIFYIKNFLRSRATINEKIKIISLYFTV